MKNFKKVIIGGLFTILGLTANAQVKLNLSLLSDHKTYMVSLIPEQSWAPPMNMIGSIQIVVKAPVGVPFSAGNITSLVNGLSWSDNSYVDHPASSPDFNFICFVLNERGTKLIPLNAGEETPLFTFVNANQDCVGTMELIDNNDPLVQAVVNNDHLNITQNITVLGARGNAYSGLANSSTDCSETVTAVNEGLSISRLSLFPVPTKDVLQINWENTAENKNCQLRISDMNGKVINIIEIAEMVGPQSLKLNVSSYPTGVYSAVFMSEKGNSRPFRFVVFKA